MRTLGVDFGGVIVERAASEDTAFFSDNFLNTPEIPDAIDSLALLNRNPEYHGNIWMVSKANSQTQAKTRLWLASYDFHERTGIPEDQLVFTDSKAEKAEVAADLEMNAFVDDQLDVLSRMKEIVPHLILFNDAPDKEPIAFIETFNSWRPLVSKLIQLTGI